MKKIAILFWTEPAVVLAVLAAAAQAAVLLPDWRSALGVVALTIGAGGATRQLSSPKQ